MRAVVLVAVVMTGLLTGCGGSGDNADEPGESALDAAYAEVADCLGEAGFEVTGKESTPLGVEVPVQGMEVDLTAEQEGQKLTVWVFESAEDAEENKTAITLSNEDLPNKSGVAGVTVFRFSYNAEEGAVYADTTMACLEG